MVNDHTRQRPARRRPRELGARLGCLAHVVVTPGRTLGTGSGVRSRAISGAPSVGLVCQVPDHCVMQGALVPAASISLVLSSDTAS